MIVNPAITLIALVQKIWRKLLWRVYFWRMNKRIEKLSLAIGLELTPAIQDATLAMAGLAAAFQQGVEYESD